MPELPEVETVRQTLLPMLKNKTIVDVDIYWNNCVITKDFKTKIQNQRILDILRFGKFLVFEFEDDVMISHLRMEGKYYLHHPRKHTNHEHVVFHLNSNEYLTYHDTRKFGKFELISKDIYKHVPPLSLLGNEPKDTDHKFLFQRLRNKKIPIKTALLDQRIMAGLGNIYVDETLYRARIHPLKSCQKITKKEASTIVKVATDVLAHATALGGSTIRTYHAMHGVDGKFQNELKVHTKQGETCNKCQSTIIKIKVGGRGTYVCPTCQKK